MPSMESLSRDSEGNENRIRDIQREVQFLKAELKDSEARYTCWKNVLTEECKDNELHFQGKLNASQSKFEAIAGDLKKSVNQCREETNHVKEENERWIADRSDQIEAAVLSQSKKVDAVKEELYKGIKEQSRKFSKENASIAQAFLSRMNEQREALDSVIRKTQDHCERSAEKQQKQTSADFMAKLGQQQQEIVESFDKKLAQQNEALQGSFEGGLAVLKDTMTQLFREEIAKQRVETEENFLRGIDKMERWLKSENSRRDSEMKELRQLLADQARELKAADEWRLEAKRQMRELVVSETSRIEESLETDRERISDLQANVEEKLSQANAVAVSMKEETLVKTSKMVKECLMLNVQLKTLENQCSKHIAAYETALEECNRTKEDMQQSFDNQNLIFQSYEDKILQHSSDFQAYLDDHSSKTEDIHSRIQGLNDDLDRLHDKVLDQEGMIEATNASIGQMNQDRATDNANVAKMGKTWESLYAHLAAELQDTIEAHDSARNLHDESLYLKAQVDDFQSQLDAIKTNTSENQTLSMSLKADFAKTDEVVKSLSESICTFATKDDLRDSLDSKTEEISTKLEDIRSDVQQRSLQTTVADKFTDLETNMTKRVEMVKQAVEKNRSSTDILQKDVDKCLIKVDVLQSNLGSMNKNVFNDLQKQVTNQAKQLLLDKQERSFAHNKIVQIEDTIDNRIQAYVNGAEYLATQEEIRAMVDSNEKMLSRNLAFFKQYVEGVASDAIKINQNVDEYRRTLETLSAQTENHSTMLNDLDNRFGVNNASVEKQLETVDKELTMLTNKIEEKVQQALDGLHNEMSALASRDFVGETVETVASKTEGRVNALDDQLSHFIKSIQRLELGVLSSDKNIEGLRANLATIDKEFGVMLTSQIESRRDVQALSKSQTDARVEMGGFVSSYEQQLKELRNVIARIGTELMGEVTKHILAQKHSMQSESEVLRENAAKLYSDINERLESISSHVKGCFRSSETKMRDILDTIEKDFETKLRKVTLSSEEQQERSTMLEDSVEMISTNIADIQATIEPAVATLSEKLKHQSRDIQASREEVAEVSAVVEQLGSRVIVMEDHERELSSAIDSKITEQSDEFSTKCEALEESLRSYVDNGITNAVTDFSEKTLETNKVVETIHNKLDTSFISCNQAVAEVNVSLNKVADQINEKLATQDKNIGSLHSSVNDGAAKLLITDAHVKKIEEESTQIKELQAQNLMDIVTIKTDLIGALGKRIESVEDSCSTKCDAIQKALETEISAGKLLESSDMQDRDLPESEVVIESIHRPLNSTMANIEEVFERVQTIHDTTTIIAEKQAQVEERFAKLDHLDCSLRELTSDQQQAANSSSEKISLLESAVMVLQQTLDSLEARAFGVEMNVEPEKSTCAIEDCSARQEKSNLLVNDLTSNDTQQKTINSVENGLQAQQNALIGLEVKLTAMEKSLSRIDCSDIPALEVDLKTRIATIDEAIKSNRASLDERMTSVETSVGDLLPIVESSSNKTSLDVQALEMDLKTHIASLDDDLKSSKASLDARVSWVEATINQSSAQVREVAEFKQADLDFGNNFDSIKEVESLRNGLARVEEKLEESTRTTGMEIADTKSMVATTAENWKKSVDGLAEQFDMKTSTAREDVLSFVSGRCEELQSRIEKAAIRSTVEAAMLKKSIGLDLQDAQTGFVSQLTALEEKSAVATQALDNRVSDVEISVQTESKTLTQLQSKCETISADVSQSVSALNGLRIAVDSNIAKTTTFQGQLEAVESAATRKSEHVAELEERLVDENFVLAQRIGALDASFYDQRMHMDMMQQKLESKATGLSEKIEQVDSQLCGTKRLLSERMDLIEADSKGGLTEVRCLVESSLKTALGAQEQVKTMRLTTLEEARKLNSLVDEPSKETTDARLTETEMPSRHTRAVDVTKEAEGKVPNENVDAKETGMPEVGVDQAGPSTEPHDETGAEGVEITTTYSIVEGGQNSTLDNSLTITIGGEEVEGASDAKEATETAPAHEEGNGSDNVSGEEPGERRLEELVEVSEVVAVDKTKKKVTIQTPTYKNTSSKKRAAKARRGNLRNALKALCDDLKSDVIPNLAAEERDTADSCTPSPEERRESIVD